jgi:hypothetical protein
VRPIANACSYESGTECSILEGNSNVFLISAHLQSKVAALTSRSLARAHVLVLVHARMLLALCLGTRSDDRSLGTFPDPGHGPSLYNTYHDDHHVEVLLNVAKIEHYEVYYESNGARNTEKTRVNNEL